MLQTGKPMMANEVKTSKRRSRASAVTRSIIVDEAMRPGANIPAVAEKFGVHKSSVYAWVRKARDDFNPLGAAVKKDRLGERLEEAFKIIRAVFAEAREAGREEIIAELTAALDRRPKK